MAILRNGLGLSRLICALARRSEGESQGLNAEISESFLSGVLGTALACPGLGRLGVCKFIELDRGTQMSFAFPGLITVA